ncbi:MAG TPA: 2,4-diaminopentanoate dehydrogenase [Candidatus Binatia bacterium]|nr:2,4-diaminopentanoate dehydrogenase [Candidatus Binatia bacterium]
MRYQRSSDNDPIRVMLLGIGQMGSGIARLITEKRGLDLVGAFGRQPEHLGIDLGRAIHLERDLQIVIGNDLNKIIETTEPQIAIQATCSRLADAFEEIANLVGHGVNVISIAEEMAYPACASPARAEELHDLAVANGVAVLGTGVNPGFVLDLLVIALTGVCAKIQSITATRVNDLSPYGPTVLRSQGVGLTPEEFAIGLRERTIVGHIGFRESIYMIAAAVGWKIAQIVESREPIIARIARQTSFVTVAPGNVAGCLHKAVAYEKDKAVITLIHPQQVQPEREAIDTGDTIEIHGEPNVRLAGSPEIPGGIATIALAVNMIPHVLKARPGLHTMADLPVPAAMLADARNFLRDRRHEVNHG